jgi:aspartate/methionine/tyrosine aminotransferase
LNVFTTLGGVNEHVSWYRSQWAGVVEALDASGMRYIKPEGSFYACIRLPHGIASLDGALQLLEEHDVLAIPGAAFGESFEGWLRLSWVAPLDRVREGVRRITKFVGEFV